MTSEEFKKTLWDAANKLRGSVSAAEYKYPVLGLVFLKYVSDLYDAQADVIRERLADPSSELYIEDEELRAESGSVAKIVKLEHAWRRLDGRNDDGFQVAPFPG